MAEREYALDLPDGNKMYVVENTHPGNRRAIIHIHGLTHDAQQHASIVMAGIMADAGYDVYRPHLYYWKEGARCLTDCTIRQHADDVNVLLADLKGRYDKIFISGHSYGGPTALECDLEGVAALSLWDPSYVPATFFVLDSKWMARRGDVFAFQGGVENIVGAAMVEEGTAYTLDVSRAKAHTCKLPVQVVHAGLALWAKFENGESFHSYNAVNDYHCLDNVSHSFVEVGAAEKLIALVKSCFDRF